MFRQKAPGAYLGFNRSPDSTLEAVKRWAPLDSDCTNSPGKSLVNASAVQYRFMHDTNTYSQGWKVFCDATVCTQTF